jgi:alcohol dehydrogenase
MKTKLSFYSNVVFGVDSAMSPHLNFAPTLKSVGILIDSSLRDNEHVKRFVQYIRDVYKIAHVQWYKVEHEPTYDDMDCLALTFRHLSIDFVIGVGGGTVLDLAKGVGILYTNFGRALDYRGLDKVQNSSLPVVLLPTTAGTGSEVTKTASFIDTVSKTKLGINGKNVACAIGVLDPLFLLSCPKNVSVFSGLDVLVHAIEAVTCRSSNSLSKLLGAEAFSIMHKALPAVVCNPQDIEARENTLLASYYAGLAMSMAGGGISSGLSYPLGVDYGIPHGLAGGISIPVVCNLCHSLGYYGGYAYIYDATIKERTVGMSDVEKSTAFLKCLQDLYTAIGFNQTLSSFGIREKDVITLAQKTFEGRKANMDLNPVPVEIVDLENIIRNLL